MDDRCMMSEHVILWHIGWWIKDLMIDECMISRSDDWWLNGVSHDVSGCMMLSDEWMLDDMMLDVWQKNRWMIDVWSQEAMMEDWMIVWEMYHRWMNEWYDVLFDKWCHHMMLDEWCIRWCMIVRCMLDEW